MDRFGKLARMLRGLNADGLGRELGPGSPGAYLVALAAISAAALAHFGCVELNVDVSPSILYNPAIFLAALVGGTRAGLLAIGLSLAVLLGVVHAHDFGDPATTVTAALNYGLYVSAALLLIWVAGRYRSLGRRSTESGSGVEAIEPLSKAFLRYVAALACIAAATVLRSGFGWLGGEILPLVSYYPAILIAALVAGMGPGLLAIIASLVVIWCQSPGPLLSPDLPTRGEAVTLSLYVFASLFTVWLAEKRRYAGAEQAQSPILQWVTSGLVACSAVLLTTFILLAVEGYVAADHLVLVYLLPTVVIAMHYGSTLAVITSFISGLAAAYCLFAPKLSFYIADTLNVAELAFFLLLAITASKAVAGLAADLRARNAR